MSSSGLLRDLQGYADSLVERHSLPAISIAVWHDNTMHRAASGILNVDTGVEATADSLFQIGSVSKVFTASLIMLLVDQGRIELDKPVKTYLRNFHVADPEATELLTVRHLLSHTSGLVSDASFTPDAHEEGDAIARYVERCFLLPQVHQQIGQRFSYSNAGYVMAGRIVEVVSGLTWRRAVEDLIFKPLEMTYAIANPAEVLRFRAAIGHFISGSDQNRQKTVASSCYLPAGMAPTGSVLTMTPADLLKFGRAHLNNGKVSSDVQWLSERSVKAMQDAQTTLPAPCLMSENQWGIGWALTDCQNVKAYGHSGGTIGQQAVLTVIPEYEAAFTAQLNGIPASASAPALQQVLSDLFYEIARVRPERSRPLNHSADVARFTGEYGATGFRFVITQKEGQLSGRMVIDGYSAAPAQIFALEPVGDNRFAVHTQAGEQMDDFTFLDLDQRGAPDYLFYGYRLHRRMRG